MAISAIDMREFYRLGKTRKKTQRIISLAPSLTETLFFLGLGPQVVGVTEQCDYPKEARNKEKIGSFAYFDMRKIISLEPDLVLACGKIHDQFLDEFKRQSITVLVLAWGTVKGIFNGMEEISRITCQEGLAKSPIHELQRRVYAVQERIKCYPSPRVFRLMGDNPIFTPTRSSYQYDAIQLAGGNPIPLSFEEAYTSISREEIVSFDPEVIISCGRSENDEPRERCPGCQAENPPCLRAVEDIKNWEGWRELSAMREGRIYALPCELICRPGPRIIDGIEMMARFFHPDV